MSAVWLEAACQGGIPVPGEAQGLPGKGRAGVLAGNRAGWGGALQGCRVRLLCLCGAQRHLIKEASAG